MQVKLLAFRKQDGAWCATGIDHSVHAWGTTLDDLYANIEKASRLLFAGELSAGLTIDLFIELRARLMNSSLRTTSCSISWPHDGVAFEICESWEEFKSKTSSQAGKLFRGQFDHTRGLVSAADRPYLENEKHLHNDGCLPCGIPITGVLHPPTIQEHRSKLLDRFREKCKELGIANCKIPDCDDGLWELGRHFGLCCPHLDWTECPLVAAYFAMVDWAQKWDDPSKSDEESYRFECEHPVIVVWELSCDQDALAAAGLSILSSNYRCGRQEKQKGKLTYAESGKPMDIVQLLKDASRQHLLRAYLIHHKIIGCALKDLHKKGIHHATLFPDEFGAAMYANLRDRLIEPMEP